MIVEEEEHADSLRTLSKYFENKYNWSHALDQYVHRSYLQPNIPKFLYYDEYYALPSRIHIKKLAIVLNPKKRKRQMH